MIIKELCDYLENIAPLQYQESYDNSGLIIGDSKQEISNVLVSLDITDAIIEEALSKKCNIIVAHHPLIFKGLKKINGSNFVENCVIKAIKNDIAIYAIHTNLDNVAGGVNYKIAEKLELTNIEILALKQENVISKLTVFVPVNHSGELLHALYKAGAGYIGNYSNCSFRSEGTGTFKPNADAMPWLGQPGKYEEVHEHRVEVIFPSSKKNIILNAMRNAHVYEEISYFVETLENENQHVGAGAIGNLKSEMDIDEFLQYLKEKMELKIIKHTKPLGSKIKRVALCGGTGSFLLNAAKAKKADVFISADFKYHEFFDAEDQLVIADIGHFESERYTKDLLVDKISNNFSNFATYLSEIDTNPIAYYL